MAGADALVGTVVDPSWPTLTREARRSQMPDDFQAMPPAEKHPRARPHWGIFFGVMFAILAIGQAILVSKWHPGSANTAPGRVAGPGGPDEEAKQSLEGNWVATEVTIDGRNGTAEDVANVKLTIAAGTVGVELGPGMGRVHQKGTLVPISTTSPKQLYVLADGRLDIRAIYELKEETLTICWTQLYGKTYENILPTEFAAKEGSGRILLVMKRQGKEP